VAKKSDNLIRKIQNYGSILWDQKILVHAYRFVLKFGLRLILASIGIIFTGLYEYSHAYTDLILKML